MTTISRDSPSSPKLKPWHLDRSAIVYVRQSTPQQVLEHQESTARQYALTDRAVDLGWPRPQVQVIDDDLGKSGQSIEGRPGFQRLLAEVALDRVGLILGLEMSRLARSCKDWHHLLELCARFRVLLADAESVYDPTEYSDRLLLGLTGMMNEAELHILKQRMYQGKLNKARRGELVVGVPVGYVKSPAGEVTLGSGRAGPGGRPPDLRPVRPAGDGPRRPPPSDRLRHPDAVTSAQRARPRGTGLAASVPGDGPPHPPPPDLRGRLRLWIPTDRSASPEARQSQERPRQRAGRRRTARSS